MDYDVYLRNGIVYLPTLGKMAEGFYRGVEPVAVVRLTDIAQARQALQTTIERGNPSVPMLPRGEIPPPVLLKYAGVRKWSDFERGMKFWTIEEKDGGFLIAGQEKQADGGWHDDPKQTITIAPGTSSDEVIDKIIGILLSAAGLAD